MADETNTPKETKPEFVKCPCCGELTLRKPLDIKSIVLDEYMSSIITGVPFAHTYTVYDSIDITAEMPSKKDAQFMFNTSRKLEKLASAQKDDDVAAKLRSYAGMIQTYGSILSIVTHKDKQVIKTYTPSESIRDLCTAIKDIGDNVEVILEACEERDTPDNLSTVPDIMIRAITKTHNDIYTILLDTGFNETFWRGIELA